MKLYYTLSIIFFSLGSVSILFMPLSLRYANSSGKVTLIINGLVFWLSFIMGYIMAWLAGKEHKARYGNPKARRAGMFRVFSNPYAKAADILTVISFVGFAGMLIFGVSSSYVCIILLFLFVLSIHMHALLNGLVFDTLINKGKEK
jgi:hypothetical protein